jgi:hypothetical protein
MKVLPSALWAIVALLPSFGAAQEPTTKPAEATSRPAVSCRGCADQKEVACPGCDGKGRTDASCPTCDSSGRRDCLLCDAVQKAIRADKNAPKIPVGKLPCSNRYCDKKGSVRVEGGGKLACKVCSGAGTFDCPACDRGKSKCFKCGGDGKRSGACEDCGGRGKLACDACRGVGGAHGCTQCGGARRHACSACGGKGAGTGRACGFCEGTSATPCATCFGSKKTPCAGCAGAGKRLVVDAKGNKVGDNRHDDCGGRGFHPCESCASKGERKCERCVSGKIQGACPECVKGKIVCRGCVIGRWRSYEIYGRAYAAASQFDLAAAYFSKALDALPAMIDDLSDKIGESDDRRASSSVESLANLRKLALTRLGAALEAAKAGKPPPNARGL